LQEEPLQDQKQDLRVAAAVLGPGFRGSRAEIEPQHKAERAKQLIENWDGDTPPKYLVQLAEGGDVTWVDRKAKLFEVGEYADKDLRVESHDLQRLAASLDAPVPVWIEHTETPLEMGYLTDIQAAGNELFGVLSLTPEADEIIEKSKAKSLSLSVSRDLDRIYEVSIVAKPRIESARLFCSDFTETSTNEWKEKAIALSEELEERRFNTYVDELMRAGKLLPVQRDYALDLLKRAARVGLHETVAQFFNHSPIKVSFGEIARSSCNRPDIPIEEAEFYSQHFPDLAIDEIARRRIA
jgi:hypothetical protein